MMNDKELKLLISLLKEIDKYGIDIFQNLIKTLRGEEDIEKLEILFDIAILNKKNKKNQLNYNKEINELITKFNEDKRNIVKKIITILNEKKYIKNLNEFTDFLHSYDINNKKTISWAFGTYSLIHKYKEENLDFFEKILIAIKNYESNNAKDRSLEGWSDIIMKNQNKKNNP